MKPDSAIVRWALPLSPRRWIGWVWGDPRQRWWRVALVAGLVAVVVPLCGGRLLPFHDASGIVGLGGALALRDDPAARVRELYDIDIRAYPSSLYFAWAYLAGAVGVPMDIAFSVFTALFSLWGPLLATLLLLSAFGRPLHLALLVLPVAYHHQIWFGFLGSSAAITGIILAIAFARRTIEQPSLGNHLGLAGAFLFIAAAHPFPLALTLAAAAPLLLWPSRRPAATAAPTSAATDASTAARTPSAAPDTSTPAASAISRGRIFPIALRVATLLPTLVFLGGWIAGFFGQRGGDGDVSFVRRVIAEVPLRLPALADAPQFVSWLGNGYTTAWDELVPLVALLTVGGLLALGTRPPPGAEAPSPPRRDFLCWVGLGWPVLVFAAGYLFLPMKLMWPEFWWGVRIRCVMPLYLLLLALPRVRPRGLPAWVTAPAAAAGFVLLGTITYDLSSYWRGRCLPGLEEAIAAIPPGRSVLAFPALPDPHYTRGHPYLAQTYVARKGGRVVPYLGGHPGSYWITLKPPPPSPPWGDPGAFVWEQHSAGWDYFLLELPVAGPPPPDPMRLAPPGAVQVVQASGRWILWRRAPAEPR